LLLLRRWPLVIVFRHVHFHRRVARLYREGAHDHSAASAQGTPAVPWNASVGKHGQIPKVLSPLAGTKLTEIWSPALNVFLVQPLASMFPGLAAFTVAPSGII